MKFVLIVPVLLGHADCWRFAQADLQGIWQAKGTAYADLENSSSRRGPKFLTAPMRWPSGNENFQNRETADTVKKCLPAGRAAHHAASHAVSDFSIGEISSRSFINTPTPSEPFIWTAANIWTESIFGWAIRAATGKATTLVVDVTDFNDQTWLDAAGDYHSDALHVVERYTRTGPKTITYEATIDDPKVFTHAWKIRVPLELDTEKNARLMEYECQWQDAAGGSQ